AIKSEGSWRVGAAVTRHLALKSVPSHEHACRSDRNRCGISGFGSEFSRVPVHAGGPSDAGLVADAGITDAGVAADAGVASGIAAPPKFGWPLPAGYTRVLSGFSVRTDPLDPERKKTESHTGMDMPAPEGTEIYAMGPGTVRDRTQKDEAGNIVGYGNYITVTHDAVWATRYAHCSEFVAKDGAIVKQG